VARRQVLFAVCVLVSHAAFAQPVYITLGGGIDGGTLDTYKLGREPNYYSSMEPVYFFRVEGEFNKYYTFKLLYQADSFFQNTVNAGLGFKMGLIHVGMGVQMGIHDLDAGYDPIAVEFWNIGVDGMIKIEFPGILYFGSDFVLDIGGGNWIANKPGSSHRQVLHFYGGFWLPHILITAGYNDRNYDAIITDTVSIRAGHRRIYGKIEFFAKNVPFRISAEAGWLMQTGNYSEEIAPGVVGWHNPVSKNSLYAGGGFGIDFSKNFRWFVNADMVLTGLEGGLFDKFSASSGFSIRVPGNK
jgi:hypothetical protein